MKTLSGLNTNISSISYSTDNKRIASGSSDNSIKIIDI
jgi:WD40 repeat protein